MPPLPRDVRKLLGPREPRHADPLGLLRGPPASSDADGGFPLAQQQQQQEQ